MVTVVVERYTMLHTCYYVHHDKVDLTQPDALYCFPSCNPISGPISSRFMQFLYESFYFIPSIPTVISENGSEVLS